jgi:hypothetical protein
MLIPFWPPPRDDSYCFGPLRGMTANKKWHFCPPAYSLLKKNDTFAPDILPATKIWQFCPPTYSLKQINDSFVSGTPPYKHKVTLLLPAHSHATKKKHFCFRHIPWNKKGTLLIPFTLLPLYWFGCDFGQIGMSWNDFGMIWAWFRYDFVWIQTLLDDLGSISDDAHIQTYKRTCTQDIWDSNVFGRRLGIQTLLEDTHIQTHMRTCNWPSLSQTSIGKLTPPTWPGWDEVPPKCKVIRMGQSTYSRCVQVVAEVRTEHAWLARDIALEWRVWPINSRSDDEPRMVPMRMSMIRILFASVCKQTHMQTHVRTNIHTCMHAYITLCVHQTI